ncbi:phasin family domain protein [Janthinobacterium agaricidamnosum NBRC 102515 = DSM 9628]|uniref:Phasin family domain protein n=1 Tax=Janthinobacterium agaricidamnosum NBRC 102515 = DSM 9628 TaxID=1349767 RepID=W0V4B4_9BURK|nr:phasin family protein [Janthinobacterium agaricidamnosum]CDG82425.1 phasin family domain protein [Janthinobacterium agaricidamnosum NBRC 102515 = DSM 9628]
MYPYSRSVSPAAKNHLEAHLSFFNDLSKSLFRSVQQFSDLNLQLAQTLLEEGTNTSHEILTSEKPEEIFNVAAAHAQPAAEKLRVYQQHVSRLAADTQVDFAKVAEDHIVETSRTAKALAEEVARIATEETEKSVRKQQDAIQRISEPFQRFSDGAQHRDAARAESSRAGQSLQSGQGNQSGGTESREAQGSNLHSGSAQGSAGQSGVAGSKTSSTGSRKE